MSIELSCFSYHCKILINRLTYVRKCDSMENKFKNILKQLRQEQQIGQVELASQIGVSKGIISLWENGLREPNMSSLILLAKFFEVTIDYLVGLEV